MRRKVGPRGVVFFSVSVDEAGRKDAVLKFLRDQRADFPDYLLNEEREVWQDRFNVKAPPAVFVFDRDGRLVKRFDTEMGRSFTYEDVGKTVEDLILPR